jgi:hypothetical protein
METTEQLRGQGEWRRFRVYDEPVTTLQQFFAVLGVATLGRVEQAEALEEIQRIQPRAWADMPDSIREEYLQWVRGEWRPES